MDIELKNLIEAINKSDYHTDPYEYFYMSSVFSEEFYQEILDSLPEDDGYEHFHHRDASIKDKDGATTGLSTRRRAKLNSTFIKKQGGVWGRFAKILYSEELKDILFDKFEKSLSAREEALGSGPSVYGAKPSVFLFRDKNGYKIAPHPDSAGKAITFQIYLPEDNSHENVGTIINKKVDKKENGRSCRSMVEHARHKFHRNSGYAFPVNSQSWHSVDTLSAPDFDRNSLMVIYYCGVDGLWEGKTSWGSKKNQRLIP
tara:strand:+ start:147 stop:920 length:774 start_codon:yes stop_codon:yes gene_type:complete